MKTSEIIDFFISEPDVRKRHSIVVDAPAQLVYKVACDFDMESIPLVRFLFWFRGKVMGAKNSSPPRNEKITPMTLLDKGWGKLAEEKGHYLIAGASCQPWEADVIFTPIESVQFNAYAEPDRVKIVWTLETEALNSNRTQLATETRAVATDEQARIKFRQYWRFVKIGIVAIRWMLLPAIRNEAIRQSETVKA